MISGGDRPSEPNLIFSLHSFVLGQIAGVLNRLRGRKRLPCDALDAWKYTLMRQKDIFSKPLVHGKILCSIQLVYSCSQNVDDVIPLISLFYRNV
jgi:hypothetical protein